MRGAKMTRTSEALISLLLIVTAALGAWADVTPEPASELPFDERVIGVARQLRLGISVALFAGSAPTIRDVRLHAQQLINLLEGVGGHHYIELEGAEPVAIGLLTEVSTWTARLPEIELEPGGRAHLMTAARNVRAYLTFSLDTALSILTERRLDAALTGMLRIYAYLAAAYEQPIEAAALPGLRTILRVLGVTDDLAGRS